MRQQALIEVGMEEVRTVRLALRSPQRASMSLTYVMVHQIKDTEHDVFVVPFAALNERCPPRQTSRVERLKAKVEPLLT